MNKMIMGQESINKIKHIFELNVYETKVWLSLLGKGIASSSEIARLSGVPRSRTYDVLEGLEKKGFVIAKMGKPVQYIGVKPKVVLEKLKNNAKRHADKRVKILSDLKETSVFKEINEIYSSGISPVKRQELSAAIDGRSNISNYLKDIIESAKKEVIVCMNASELNSKTRLFFRTFNILKKSNVKVILALSGDDKTIRLVANKFKIRAKKVDVDSKFFIVDRKEMLFYLSEDKDIAVWLSSEFFTKAFTSLFDMAVDSGK